MPYALMLASLETDLMGKVLARREPHDRIQVRERDLFGRWASRWRVIRTSNAYVFRDPQQRPAGVPACNSENRIGIQNQEVIDSSLAAAGDPSSPWSAPCSSWRRHQRKIAPEQGRRDGPCHLTNTAERG